jgi:hypothetical protein
MICIYFLSFLYLIELTLCLTDIDDLESETKETLIIKDHQELLRFSRQLASIVNRAHNANFIFGNFDLSNVSLRPTTVSMQLCI